MSNINNLSPTGDDKFSPGSFSALLKRDVPFISQCFDGVGVPKDSIRVPGDTKSFLPFQEPEASIPVKPSPEIICDELLVKRRFQEVVSFILANAPDYHLQWYLPRIKADCAEILGLFSRFNSRCSEPDDIRKLDKMANILRVDTDCESIPVYATVSHPKASPIGRLGGLGIEKGFIPKVDSRNGPTPGQSNVTQTEWAQYRGHSGSPNSVFLGDIRHGHSGVSVFNNRIDFFDIHEIGELEHRIYYSSLWGGSTGVDWAIGISGRADSEDIDPKPWPL